MRGSGERSETTLLRVWLVPNVERAPASEAAQLQLKEWASLHGLRFAWKLLIELFCRHEGRDWSRSVFWMNCQPKLSDTIGRPNTTTRRFADQNEASRGDETCRAFQRCRRRAKASTHHHIERSTVGGVVADILCTPGHHSDAIVSLECRHSPDQERRAPLSRIQQDDIDLWASYRNRQSGYASTGTDVHQ